MPDDVIFFEGRRDLRIISASEKLILLRYRTASDSPRRKGRAGAFESQPEAARRLGIGVSAYRRLEAGHRTELRADQAEAIGRSIVDLEPSLGERCFLARRRSGFLLFTIERELGVSRPRFHEMERAGHPAIVRRWEDVGYTF